MGIKVNGEWVSDRAVIRELERLVQFYREHFPEEDLEELRDTLIRKAREQAVGARLLLIEADRLGLKAAADEVESRYRTLVQEAGGPEAFESVMDGQAVDEEWVRRGIADSIRVDQFVALLVARLPAPTERDIDAFCERLGVESAGAAARERARDLLMHERRGRAIAACVAQLREKAAIEEGSDVEGADIDALFDACLDADAPGVPGEGHGVGETDGL